MVAEHVAILFFLWVLNRGRTRWWLSALQKKNSLTFTCLRTLPRRRHPSRRNYSDQVYLHETSWTTSIPLMTTHFWCLIPWVLPLLSTGQLINQTEREKLEKLFPLCFQHWLSALLMPRSVANQRNYRWLGAPWCRPWLESDELHQAEIRRTNKETVTVVEQRMHMEINDPCSC